MIFEWDEKKNQLNQAKHGLGFASARSFDWETCIIREDNRSVYNEKRWIAWGYIGKRLCSLVFTKRLDNLRIISLRKANPRERNRYEKSKRASKSV